jgi:hypothetical protein
MQNEGFLSVKSVKSLSTVALAKADAVQFLWLRPAALDCKMSESLRSAKILPRMARMARIRAVWSKTISNP